jgi:3-phenylpropionate/cinnamic acid dioxygenase small subunit
MMFQDWQEINALLVTYAEHADEGRFEDFAALFEHGSYRLEPRGSSEVAEFRGYDEVLAYTRQTRLFADGTPRTRHVLTNLHIEIDGDQANSRCYGTVFQQTDELPLQPIACGRYLTRFERIDGTWWIAQHVVKDFLRGDRSQHVEWHEDMPAHG